MNSRVNQLSRKDPNDANSVRLWLDFFSSRGDYSLYKIHPDGGPFVVSWISKWQMKVSANLPFLTLCNLFTHAQHYSF